MTDEDPTGGLTFDPPSVDHEATQGIGFAPDLTDDEAPFFATSDAKGSAAVDETSRYPRAMAVLARLLSGRENDAAEAPSVPRTEPDIVPTVVKDRAESPDEGARKASVGPAITRAPAPFVRPKDRMATPERTEPRPGSEALMEMLLVGKNDAGAREAHFQFHEDVLGGMYLHLERRSEGLFMRFTVGDDGDRRALAAYVDELVARFERKGTRVVGYEIVVGDAETR